MSSFIKRTPIIKREGDNLYNLAKSSTMFIQFTPVPRQQAVEQVQISFLKVQTSNHQTSSWKKVILEGIREYGNSPSACKQEKKISNFDNFSGHGSSSTKNQPMKQESQEYKQLVYLGKRELHISPNTTLPESTKKLMTGQNVTHTNMAVPQNNLRPFHKIQPVRASLPKRNALRVMMNDNDFDSDGEMDQEVYYTDAELEEAREITLTFCRKPESLQGVKGEKYSIIPLAKVIGYSKREEFSLAKRNNKKYVCKYCGAVFGSGCALGGHVSKIHRGVNVKYTKKKIQRRANQVERERTKFMKNFITKKL